MTKWKLVPVEPTETMKFQSGIPMRTAGLIYRDMLAFAPSPPEELAEKIENELCRHISIRDGGFSFDAGAAARAISALLSGGKT